MQLTVANGEYGRKQFEGDWMAKNWRIDWNWGRKRHRSAIFGSSITFVKLNAAVDYDIADRGIEGGILSQCTLTD